MKHYSIKEYALDIAYDNSNEAENALREQSSHHETNDNVSNDIWNIPNHLDLSVVNTVQSNDLRAAHKDFWKAEKFEKNGLVAR